MTLGLARAQTSCLPSPFLHLILELDDWRPQKKGSTLSLLLSKAMFWVSGLVVAPNSHRRLKFQDKCLVADGNAGSKVGKEQFLLLGLF